MSTTTHLPDTDCLAYTAADLARVLNVSERRVWSLHNRSLLPRPIRLGRSVRWGADELRRWLSAGAPRRHEWQAMNARRSSPAYRTSSQARRTRKQRAGPKRKCKLHHQNERAPSVALTFWRDSLWRLLALLIVVYSGWEHSSVHVSEQVQIVLVIGASPELARLLKLAGSQWLGRKA